MAPVSFIPLFSPSAPTAISFIPSVLITPIEHTTLPKYPPFCSPLIPLEFCERNLLLCTVPLVSIISIYKPPYIVLPCAPTTRSVIPSPFISPRPSIVSPKYELFDNTLPRPPRLFPIFLYLTTSPGF